jgi:hypothetical protein
MCKRQGLYFLMPFLPRYAPVNIPLLWSRKRLIFSNTSLCARSFSRQFKGSAFLSVRALTDHAASQTIGLGFGLFLPGWFLSAFSVVGDVFSFWITGRTSSGFISQHWAYLLR